MAVSIPFQFIPQDILVPGFFFEVRALDNTGLLQFQTLMMGQLLPTGSLGPIDVATSAATNVRHATAAVLVAGGTGYAADDVLTVSGGTSSQAAQITVDSVTGGVITTYHVSRGGSYSVLPSNPVSVTGGTGTGATFTMSWAYASVLTFASVPVGVIVGMVVTDQTHSSAILAGTTVTAHDATTVTLSNPVQNPGVSSADIIQFTPAAAHGPVLVSTAKQAKQLFGPGSMLANMVKVYRDTDNFGTLYCLPLYDDPAAVAATGQIAITGTVSVTSVLYLYIAGVRIPVKLTAAMTNDDIAIAVVASINLNIDLPVTATGTSFPITLTANNAGEAGNDIDIRINYHGIRADEVTPVGLVVSITPMASGALNPALDAPLATLGSTPFDVILGPYADDVSLASVKLFLDDESGRWSYLQELFGHYFTAANKTVGDLTTLGMDLNYQHISILGLYKSPTPPYALAAALGAQASVSLRADPGLPLNTLELTDCLAPALADQFTTGDRQTLLTAGIGTARVDPGQNLIIDRIVTTFTQNEFFQSDDSFQNVEKMFCIAFMVRYTASILSGLYSRVKLAQDGTRIPVGSNIVTPAVVKGSLISIYGDLVDLGIAQNFEYFAKNVVVQINTLNPNRLDVMMPVTTIFQLDTTAISLQLVI